MEETKEFITNKIAKLANRHEAIKSEMIQIVDASKILDQQYKLLESELYKVEEEYVGLINKLMK